MKSLKNRIWDYYLNCVKEFSPWDVDSEAIKVTIYTPEDMNKNIQGVHYDIIMIDDIIDDNKTTEVKDNMIIEIEETR